jgi:hypothetical protein
VVRQPDAAGLAGQGGAGQVNERSR